MYLSPIKLNKYKVKYKEGHFILDCTNIYASKLQSYNSINDKFLDYYVVKVPKKNNIFKTRKVKQRRQET
jgi:hypothetical protein